MTNTPNRNYPLVDPTHHVADDVMVLIAAFQAIDIDVNALIGMLSGKAATVHVHTIEQVTGLTAALAGKASADFRPSLGGLTNVDTAADTAEPGSILQKGPSGWIVGSPTTILGTHNHPIANIEGLTAALDSKLTASSLPASLLAYTTKATPVDADTFLGIDSADANAPKRFTWLAIKTALKNYLDTFYAGISHSHAFAALTSKPTTLGGYGITDALTRANPSATGTLYVDDSAAAGVSAGLNLRGGAGAYSLIDFFAHGRTSGAPDWRIIDDLDGATLFFNHSGASSRLAVRSNGNVDVAGSIRAGTGLIRLLNGNYGIQYDGGATLGFVGADGGWRMYVNNAGQLWTSQLGDVHTWIEARASAWAATRMPMADVSLGQNALAFQLGTPLYAAHHSAQPVGRNGFINVYLLAGSIASFTLDPAQSGGQLAGTWVMRGMSSNDCTVQRVA